MYLMQIQLFLILKCARTVLHTSIPSTSCYLIIPDGTWNINLLYRASNNLIYACYLNLSINIYRRIVTP